MCEARYFSVAPYKMRSDIERTAANEKQQHSERKEYCTQQTLRAIKYDAREV